MKAEKEKVAIPARKSPPKEPTNMESSDGRRLSALRDLVRIVRAQFQPAESGVRV